MTKRTRPLDQGEEDGFCGLYAITNCIRLLYPKQMNDDLSAGVFKVLCKTLTHWPAIIWDGTEHEDLCMMLDTAQGFLAKQLIAFDWHLPFAHHRVNGFLDFQTRLGDLIKDDDAFAIVGLSEPWEHWTVAHKFIPGHILMTDSCHVKQIPLARCGLSGEYGTTYQFDHKDTFVLSRPS